MTKENFRFVRIFSLALILFNCLQLSAQTNSLAFSRNARTFETVQSNLLTKALAHSCLTVYSIADGLLCNPAFVPLTQSTSFAFDGTLSNGVSSLNRVRSLLRQELSSEVIDALFTRGNFLQLETSASLTFKSKYLAGQYTPYSIKAFSLVRNEANPNVDLYAVEESRYTFQSGLQFDKYIYFGGQVRALNRKHVKKRFQLLSLATDAGKDSLKPIEEQKVFFEPSVTFQFAGNYKPRVTLMAANLGSEGSKDAVIREKPELQVGLGLTPPFEYGDLTLSVDYKSLSYEEENLEKLHLGGLYQYGSMNLGLGWDVFGYSAGILYSLQKFSSGILYTSTQLGSGEENAFTQTVYVQLGWQL